MPKFTRRGFIAATAAAGTLRIAPSMATKPPVRRVLTLVYDKSLGMMRAVDRLVP
ncbi:Tat pathway signal protein [Sulfitobacter aestuariivivens]|uniref:Tat pathway signal protein n=1 Tax=Sulfitobacter aestuariivivens TaxID=2766981 RepID=A0A927HDH0_9RHOB|nr:Tat pathway signal protein [Sulfitobacter aestuariivivens]MBD3662801.1 Tat pathway signal protein [Sulfitobacter aestuariivivens]